MAQDRLLDGQKLQAIADALSETVEPTAFI